MKRTPAVLILLFSFLIPGAFAGTRPEAEANWSLEYQGGNLPYKQDKAVRATFENDHLVLLQGRDRITISARQIQTIASNGEAERRPAVPGLTFLPLKHKETRYVAVSWTQDGKTVDALFRVTTPEFISALEQLTGKRAIDPNVTPTVVRYGR